MFPSHGIPSHGIRVVTAAGTLVFTLQIGLSVAFFSARQVGSISVVKVWQVCYAQAMPSIPRCTVMASIMDILPPQTLWERGSEGEAQIGEEG